MGFWFQVVILSLSYQSYFDKWQDYLTIFFNYTLLDGAQMVLPIRIFVCMDAEKTEIHFDYLPNCRPSLESKTSLN